MPNLRSLIIKLHEEGKGATEIGRRLGMHRNTVCYAIKRYQETGSNDDRPRSGRPRTTTTAANRWIILNRIGKNPSSRKNSVRKLAKAVGVSYGSVRKILKDAGLKPRKEVEAQLLTKEVKRKRVRRCRMLHKRFAAKRHRTILFTDEKWFNVEQANNRQNDRRWLKVGIVAFIQIF